MKSCAYATFREAQSWREAHRYGLKSSLWLNYLPNLWQHCQNVQFIIIWSADIEDAWIKYRKSLLTIVPTICHKVDENFWMPSFDVFFCLLHVLRTFKSYAKLRRFFIFYQGGPFSNQAGIQWHLFLVKWAFCHRIFPLLFAVWIKITKTLRMRKNRPLPFVQHVCHIFFSINIENLVLAFCSWDFNILQI